MGRYAVFIDNGYLRATLKRLRQGPIDYEKLGREVHPGADELLRIYVYDCPPYIGNPPTKEERERQRKADAFFEVLRRIPRVRIQLGRLQRSFNAQGEVRFEQKQVDVLLSLDLVRLSLEHQIQTAVLIAGDADFVPAIDVAREAGTVIRLFHGAAPSPHRELVQACDEHIPIDKALVERLARRQVGE